MKIIPLAAVIIAGWIVFANGSDKKPKDVIDRYESRADMQALTKEFQQLKRENHELSSKLDQLLERLDDRGKQSDDMMKSTTGIPTSTPTTTEANVVERNKREGHSISYTTTTPVANPITTLITDANTSSISHTARTTPALATELLPTTTLKTQNTPSKKSGASFTQKYKTSCGKSKYKKFSSLQEAQTECGKDSECSGVYDVHCDGKYWYLCPYRSTYSSTASCTYMKEGTLPATVPPPTTTGSSPLTRTTLPTTTTTTFTTTTTIRWSTTTYEPIFPEYKIRENAWCSPKRKPPVEDLSAAKKRCTDDPSCTMLYGATQFYLCHIGADIKVSSKGNRLYIKDLCVDYCRNFGNCTLAFENAKYRPSCECAPQYEGERCEKQAHYTIQDNAWCKEQKYEEYVSLLEATKACSLDRGCTMFFDIESKNEKFVLCPRESFSKVEVKSSAILRSRLYIKSYIECESKTTSGPDSGKHCQFPFEYKGAKYHGCTETDSFGHPWCATGAQYSNNTYGYCNCSKLSYIRISSGSCETHGMRMITSKPLCGAAAWNLGLSATVSSYQDSWRPYGCTHGGKFVTTLQLKSPRDAPDVYATYGSSDCSDIIDCICTTQVDIDEAAIQSTTSVQTTTTTEIPLTIKSTPKEKSKVTESPSWQLTTKIVIIGVFTVALPFVLCYTSTQGMTNLKAMLQRAKVTFKLVCFILAAYMTTTQFQRYFENKDTSVIAFRRFNARTVDKYPTFTFCIYAYAGDEYRSGIYSETVAELHMTKRDYSNLLKGFDGSTEKPKEKLKQILEIDHEIFTMRLRMILDSFYFRAKHANNTISYDGMVDKNNNVQILKSSFDISHQDPDQICFTRNSETRTNILRKNDEVTLNVTSLKNWVGSSALFRVYIHYPGQLTRSMDKPVVETTLAELGYLTTTAISLKIPYVAVLRKRPEANTACNLTLANDDNEFKIIVIKQVGCIPIYWKSLVRGNMSMSLCKTSNKLQDVYRHIKERTDIMSTYYPPCVEMQIPVRVQEKKHFPKLSQMHVKLNLSISYSTETYQEINNLRDYDLETLWSSIGGFIGIFIGYSLLQVADLFDDDWRPYWRVLTNISCSVAYACTVVTAYLFHKRTPTVTNVMERNDEELSAIRSGQAIDATTEQNTSEGDVFRNRLDNVEENLHKVEEKLDALINKIYSSHK